MGILSNYAAFLGENGIKQSFIVEKTGLPQPKVSRLMNKTDSLCDVEDYAKLCKAVKKAPGYFFVILDKVELKLELEDWEKEIYSKYQNGQELDEREKSFLGIE